MLLLVLLVLLVLDGLLSGSPVGKAHVSAPLRKPKVFNGRPTGSMISSRISYGKTPS
jgi:hypothetical protein